MIVRMKRVFVLCLEDARAAALKRLAALGAVQIEREVAESPAIAAAGAGVAAAETARDALREAAANPDPYGLAIRRARPEDSDDPAVRHVLSVVGRWLDARDERKALEATLARFAPWGDFDPAAARALAEKGVPFALFSVPADFDFSAFPKTGALQILSRNKERICGALAGAPLPEGVEAAPLPEEPLSATRRRIADAEARMRMAAGTLRTLSREKDAVLASAERFAGRREWAFAAENLRAAGPVAHLAGWCPEDALPALLDAAREEGWGVASRDPEEGETPPVLLRTPRLFRPIGALFQVLGILPGYRESDVSVVFYSFFTVFFAMLIGDAGYGALLLLAALLVRRSLRRRPEPPSELASSSLALMFVFGGATLVWGVLSGTYFGMPSEWLPGFLSRDLPTARWLSDQSHIMHLCFGIGLAHLLIARVWNIVQLWPDSRALSELGWIGVLYGMYNIVCSIVVEGFAYPAHVTWVMAAAVVLILCFTYKRSELKENVVSLCMTPLNVVSSMGDIISYVRLFAVGLASVKIAETFDTMAAGLALPLWAKIPCVALILLLGHALNIAMGGLSILVHAVRLNTLEFSNAKGITWCGSEYAPFRAPPSDR